MPSDKIDFDSDLSSRLVLMPSHRQKHAAAALVLQMRQKHLFLPSEL